jgi:hypothetical protein
VGVHEAFEAGTLGTERTIGRTLERAVAHGARTGELGKKLERAALVQVAADPGGREQ